MSPRLIIFSPTSSRRLDYVCDFIFGSLGQVDFEITTEVPVIDSKSQIIAYSKHFSGKASVHISPFPSLQENEHLQPPNGDYDWLKEYNPDMDIFHFVFFHLSRADEFNHQTKDFHGRVISKESWLGKHGYHRSPVVDRAVVLFFNHLNAFFRTDEFQIRTQFSSQLTIDVDQLFAYRRKPLYRFLGSALKDAFQGRWPRFVDRFHSIRDKNRDPYFVLDWMVNGAQDARINVLVFFLMKGLSKYDRQVKLSPKDFNFSKGKVKLGLHPSYLSGDDLQQLKREKIELESLTKKPVKRSRFHFLRFSVPIAYRHLIQANLLEDYSLSWSDEVGFRAGTAHSFYWYDIENEEKTPLILRPSVAMDVVLKDRLKLTPDEAMSILEELIEEVSISKGEARVIWHNSSFDPTEGWGGWRDVFYKIIDLLASK